MSPLYSREAITLNCSPWIMGLGACACAMMPTNLEALFATARF